MPRRLTSLLLLVTLFLVTTAQAAPVRIVLQVTDPAGTGFRDPQWGPSRLSPFRQAAAMWSQKLVAAYPGETIRIRLQTGDTGRFAGIGNTHRTYWNYPGLVADTVYPAALANHVARRDLEPAQPESSVTIGNRLSTISRTLTWRERRDYLALALHEIGHGLGFLTAIGTGGQVRLTPNHPPFPMIWDRFLRNSPRGGQALIGLTDAQRSAATRSNRLYWVGSRGVAANAGTRPRLNARRNFVEGSSILHLEGATHPTALMQTGAPIVPAISDLDLALLRDMGWRTAATPAVAATSAPSPVAAPSPTALPVAGILLALASSRRVRSC